MNLPGIKLSNQPASRSSDACGASFSHFARRVPVVFALVLALLAPGCTSHELRSSFSDYGEAYAEAQNRQMLLNLARLSQHHPTYFFQLGQINASYNYTTSVSASGGQSDKSGFVGGSTVPFINWIVSSLSGTASRSSTPTFTYVPLSGGDFAAHLITPLVPDTFHALFREGFPVDVLMRALVQEIHFTPPGGNADVVLHNLPTLENKTNYARFLRLCDTLRDLQERGYLVVQKMPRQIEPVVGPEMTNAPAAKDVIDAAAQKLNWKTNREGKWYMERENDFTNSPAFELTPEGVAWLGTLKLEPYRSNEIANVIYLLGPENTRATNTFVQLRSFLFVLADMADEETSFAALRCDPYFASHVPPAQLRPILRTDWSGVTNRLEIPLVKVNYQGKQYQITDYKEAAGYHCRTNSWNRDVFTLATTLATQVSVDPAKINYQLQFLQVR